MERDLPLPLPDPQPRYRPRPDSRAAVGGVTVTAGDPVGKPVVAVGRIGDAAGAVRHTIRERRPSGRRSATRRMSGPSAIAQGSGKRPASPRKRGSERLTTAKPPDSPADREKSAAQRVLERPHAQWAPAPVGWVGVAEIGRQVIAGGRQCGQHGGIDAVRDEPPVVGADRRDEGAQRDLQLAEQQRAPRGQHRCYQMVGDESGDPNVEDGRPYRIGPGVTILGGQRCQCRAEGGGRSNSGCAVGGGQHQRPEHVAEAHGKIGRQGFHRREVGVAADGRRPQQLVDPGNSETEIEVVAEIARRPQLTVGGQSGRVGIGRGDEAPWRIVERADVIEIGVALLSAEPSPGSGRIASNSASAHGRCGNRPVAR